MAVVRINHLEVDEGEGHVLEERFGSRLRRIEAEGFLGWQLLRPQPGTDGPYLAITWWVDDEAFEAWRNGAAFHEGHKRAPAGREPVARPVGLTAYDVAAAASSEVGATSWASDDGAPVRTPS